MLLKKLLNKKFITKIEKKDKLDICLFFSRFLVYNVISFTAKEKVMKKIKKIIAIFMIIMLITVVEKYTKAAENSQTIEDGTYVIKSALNNNFVLDVSGASKSECANIQIYQNANVDQQKFKVKYLGSGYYSLTAVHSNKVLDVANAAKTNGTNVWQHSSNNTDAQKWIIKDAGNGYYYVISKCNNLYLDIYLGTAKNETNVQVYEGNGTNAQKFKFEKVNSNTSVTGTKTVEDGTYQIKTALNNNFVLDVSGASKSDGANIQIYQNANVNQQRFNVKYLGNGYYTLSALHSNKVLDVANGGKTNGTNVWQYSSNNTDAQKWVIKDAGNGYYYIISKSSNLYLDVQNATAKSGTNVQVYEGNGTNAQKFKFEKVDTTIQIDTNKYPGYKEKLTALKKAHPDWNIKFLYTNLKFETAVAGEASVHSRNLVETSHSGEWICSVCGTKLYDSGWYCASEKAIAYYLDPRNFLDEINIFQFLDVNEYNDSCTLDGIKKKVNGTFLQNYTNDIQTACRNKNVNPYYIIARLIQEQGSKGTTIGKGMNGGDGKTYYNPFNIGASGNGYDQIYANALARAKREGWDTMEKALEGGIYFCKANWLENDQNTLYQNRWDIVINDSSLYSHQYMQNLLGAYSEAKTLYEMYNSTGKVNSNFTFIIPVYEEMGSSTFLPSDSTEVYPINVATTGTYVRIRKGASTNSDIIQEIANSGTVLLSVERGVNSDWQKVVLPDGRVGYVSGKYLKQVNDVKTCNYKAKVKTNDGYGCRIRVGPGTDHIKITTLPDGEEVTVIDNSTYKNIDGYDWYRIVTVNGRQAFIPGKYLK